MENTVTPFCAFRGLVSAYSASKGSILKGSILSLPRGDLGAFEFLLDDILDLVCVVKPYDAAQCGVFFIFGPHRDDVNIGLCSLVGKILNID